MSGCATGLGPKAVRSERSGYNQQIVRSADAEMLLNLVRLRYNDSPLFLELGTVVTQYSYDASFNERLRSAGLIGLNWETKEHETDPPGRNPQFWVRPPADPNSPLATDVAAVRGYLQLEPGRDDFTLTAFPFRRQPSEVGMRCRSLLGVLYFLSQSVEPPAPHVQAGLLTVTEDENGQPFDWSKVTGKVMTIHSREDRPQKAYVAVQHRGWWFYLADDDQSSKATFSLLNILLSLQSATGKGKSPILTLPVGK